MSESCILIASLTNIIRHKKNKMLHRTEKTAGIDGCKSTPAFYCKEIFRSG